MQTVVSRRLLPTSLRSIDDCETGVRMRLLNICVIGLSGLLHATHASAGLPWLPHPYDYIMHAGAGTAIGYFGSRELSPAAGILLSAAAGVGKEMLDKKYDPKDAWATVAGGLIGVGLYLALKPDDDTVIVFGPGFLAYRTRF